MNICMVGTGYVGLVTGACLADFGMDVTCVDKDETKIALLKKGVSPIYEPGLEELIHKNEKAGRLRFSTNIVEAIERSLVIFIAVGTPPQEDGSPDLSFIFEVAESIATHMNGYKVVVTKSTVPTGTGAQIEEILRTKNGRYKFSVVSNPEFLREGSAIEDFMHPDRVVIGSRDEEAIAIVKDVYSPLSIGGVPFVVTDVESAELIKYASNGFLALKISFINEVAAMCERMGADVKDVARGMGLDKRIAPHFLNPGPGYGGSCFPKDSSAVVDLARKNGYTFEIMEAVLSVNDHVKARMVEKVAAVCPDLAGQARRHARDRLQAGDRRHPRERVPEARGRPPGARRRRRGLRPGRDGQRAEGDALAQARRRRLLLCRRGRRPRPGDRLEPVPQARPRPARKDDEGEELRRPPQPLRAEGDEESRLELRGPRPRLKRMHHGPRPAQMAPSPHRRCLMAMTIQDTCINCGSCEPECPNQAITAGDPTFVVDAARCTECVGAFDAPKCVEICPIEGCIVTEPAEPRAVLEARYAQLHA